jgi:ATP-binding cassette, subfamily G (WHITE), member 1
MDVTKFDIKFENISYHIQHGIAKKCEKRILKNVSGDFRFFELTGIIGTTGSGKTTLLNVLSGFISKNVQGHINIQRNNENQSKVKFIMQEENFFKLLTVSEAMNFSLKFKTGNQLNDDMRLRKIMLTLDSLSMGHKLNDFVGNLSGGERKKLSMAVELLDNPKFFFLDEPTTNLDSVSTMQCVKLLKKLALDGKTVVCTIHQPSASVLKMFDHIYALSEGECIYQGSPENIVPFLSKLNITCPHTYTPTDFLMEIIGSGDSIHKNSLVRQISNGKNEEFRSNLNNNNSTNNLMDDFKLENEGRINTPSFLFKLITLMKRNCLLAKRDKTNALMRISVHILVALFIGILYFNSGNSANNILNNFKFLFMLCGFLGYSSFYSLLTKCKYFFKNHIYLLH